MHARTITCAVVAAAAGLMACHSGFRIARYPTNESLYTAGLHEFEREHWGNAVTAFERLTNQLSPRDTLLPRSYWYLASAHEHEGDHLLAAQSFSRLFQSFPDDTLADDAALQAARAYRRMWRKPSLDPTYGETALAMYNTLLGLYPNTAYADSARAEIAELEQWFATKNYETGMFYLRRKAYDSAILYFKDVVERWPNVPRVRDALLRLAEAYKAIRYGEDLADTCRRLRGAYPGDRDVREVCGAAPADAARPAPASSSG